MSTADGTPRRIGGYDLLEEIGRGGMGKVYRAHDRHGNTVAVKVANAIIEDSSAQVRFVNEALLKLEHPNIVRVLDVGTDGDTSYLVYNFLEGETVQQILSRGPMDSQELLSMGLQLCDALAAAHQVGVIHRDVKPANIVRSPEGRYTLIDFGLALWNSDETRMTSHGQILGTPRYLPPEQARGEIDIDGRSDLWSLGILLYEAASGVSPFDREAPLATMLAVVMDEPVPLGDVAPESSAEVRVAVTRALRKARDERWQDAMSFAEALRVLPQVNTKTKTRPTTLSESERRLVVVLLAEDLSDPLALGHAVAERDGVFIQLGKDRAVGIFGGSASEGDELVRATQVGLDCLGAAQRLAVAAGHATGQRSVVSGATLASAQAACKLGLRGVAVDAASARALAGRYEVQARGGGHVVVGARESSGTQELVVGRELELAQILRDVELVVEESEPRLVQVCGHRGIGKSFLLRIAGARIGERIDGAITLRARAEASSRETALALLASLMETHFLEELGRTGAANVPLSAESIETLILEGRDTERSICADFLAELVRVPSRESVQVRASRSDPQLRKDQIYFAVRSYLTGLASRQPVFLLLDDLQWSDLASITVLSDVFAACTGLPLGIVGTALPENEERYAPLFEAHQHTRVEVPPLSRLQVAKLAEAIACQPLPEAATAALAGRTHGNPLFVEHLVRDMYAGVGDVMSVADMPLPPTVEVAVQSHLDNLGPSVKELCKRASVFTHAFSADELETLGVPREEAVLDWLVQRGVLGYVKVKNNTERRYAFRSTLVAEVAYGMLLVDQRQGAHLRAAQTLSVRRTENPEDVARHYSLGGSNRDAAHWYERAAQLGAQSGDSDTVLRCSSFALQLAPGTRDFELHMTRSDAFRFLGFREEQADELECALRAAQSSGERARAMTEFAWNLSRTGKVPQALTMAEAAVDAGRDTDDRECLALALGWRAVALAQLGRLDDAVDALGEALQTAKGLSAHVAALAADWRAQVHGARGDLAQRLLAFEDAETQYMAIGDVRRAAGAACNVADLYNRLGDYQHAEKELRHAREGCRRVNNRLVEGYATANLGYALMRQNRVQEALHELDQALVLANETNETVLRMVVGIYSCRVELGVCPAEEILAAARSVAAEASEIGLEPLAAMALAIASTAALSAGNGALALELAQDAMSIRDRLGGLEEDEAELYVALADGFEACGHALEATQTRQRGRERVLAIANGITDPGLRETFLAIGPHALLLGQVATARD